MLEIAVIPGDGVGKEVIPAGLRVLEQVASFEAEVHPWGAEYYAQTGSMMPTPSISVRWAGRPFPTTSASGAFCSRSERPFSSTSTFGPSGSCPG